MKKTSSLLEKRFEKSNTEKIKALVQERSQGNLSFLAKFEKKLSLPKQESEQLFQLLKRYTPNETNPLKADLLILSDITAEIKTINHQAILLHGERIKKAQSILKNYKDGAFSSWLIISYGNRQTPYNFLSYYELYLKLSPVFKNLLEQMPKHLAYTLALKQGPIEKKEKILESYNTNNKSNILSLIRSSFPLNKNDARQYSSGETINKFLLKALELLKDPKTQLKEKEMIKLHELLKKIEIAKNKLV